MPYIDIWIHAVWSTKRRAPILSDSIRKSLFSHMVQVGRLKGIKIDRINGHVDHVHMLFTLTSTQTIADIMHQIKGESSRWINTNRLTSEPFAWQSNYYAIAVNSAGLRAVRLYIDQQQIHHEKRSFRVEQKELMKLSVDTTVKD